MRSTPSSRDATCYILRRELARIYLVYFYCNTFKLHFAFVTSIQYPKSFTKKKKKPKQTTLRGKSMHFISAAKPVLES